MSLIPLIFFLLFFFFHQGKGRAMEWSYLLTVKKIRVENIAHCTYKTDLYNIWTIVHKRHLWSHTIVDSIIYNVPFVDNMYTFCWRYVHKMYLLLTLCTHNVPFVDNMYTFCWQYVHKMYLLLTVCTQNVPFVDSMYTQCTICWQDAHKRYVLLLRVCTQMYLHIF